MTKLQVTLSGKSNLTNGYFLNQIKKTTTKKQKNKQTKINNKIELSPKTY